MEKLKRYYVVDIDRDFLVYITFDPNPILWKNQRVFTEKEYNKMMKHNFLF